MSTERERFEAWAGSITPAGSPKPVRNSEIAWYAWQARAALAQPAVREPLTEPELPQPSLLVESAQGFVEGWTRSQVRSAINLALLKQRYSQPAVPAPTTQVPVAWHKMARVWIGGDVFEDRWVACSEDSAGAEPLYAQSTQSAKEKQA